MICSLIKNFCIFLTCYYLLYRLNTGYKFFQHKICIIIVLSTLLSFSMYLLKAYIPVGAYVLSLLLYCSINIHLSKNRFPSSFTISVVIYGLCFIVFSLSSFCVLMLIMPLRDFIAKYDQDILIYLSCAVHIVLIWLISRSNFFKNIMHSLTAIRTLNIGVFITLLVIATHTIEQLSKNTADLIHFLRLFSSIILCTMLMFWWRSQITKSYREKLRLLEVESLRTSQQEQANYISQLEKENERMGRILHKDNRIVNAMADSVAEYLKDTTLSDAERHNKGVALAKQIESIRTDRQNILLSEEHIHPNPISQTGYVGVDALIAYMAKEAAQHRIALHFDFQKEFFENDSLCMSEEDLVHLLSDTLKNAIIATRHNNGKDIKLSMLKLKGIPTIAISDSGIPFAIDTYMNFGLEKASTHMDEGGSGIGLLDIWSLKEKYKITLYIDEYPTTDTFTKQMVFIFDKKNRYMISSNRYKEIQHQQSRADLYVVNPAVERSL